MIKKSQLIIDGLAVEMRSGFDELALMVQRGFEHVTNQISDIKTEVGEVKGNTASIMVRMEKMEKGQKNTFNAIHELPSPESFIRMRQKITDLDDRVSVLETRKHS